MPYLEHLIDKLRNFGEVTQSTRRRTTEGAAIFFCSLSLHNLNDVERRNRHLWSF